MSHEMDELILSFKEEANETLADIENQFLAIEQAGENFDRELVNEVFRGIHSMKGSAGFIGLKAIGRLAHEMENVLNLIRNEELVPGSRVIDALLKAADALRGMVNDIETSNEVEVSSLLTQLQQAVQSEASEEVQEALNRDIDIPLPDGRLAFVMIQESNLVLSQRRQNHIYVVEVDFFQDIHDKGQNPRDFLNTVYQQGELLNSYMSTAGIGNLSSELPDSMMFMMLLASTASREELAERLNVPLDRVYKIASPQTRWTSSGPEADDAESVSEATGSAMPETPVSAAAKTPQQSSATGEPAAANADENADVAIKSVSQNLSSLRVHVKVLDRLMNLAGELVLGRNQLLQEAGSRTQSGIEAAAARIDQVTSELQEAIMQTRMQPIGTVFNKFPRIVRDLSNKLGKECKLEIDGNDVEMDKTIIEAISDPLTHLIRNAVDHGVEMPEARKAAGKPVEGTLKLAAFHQAGKVNITIVDDGAGMDHERIRQKAVAKGLLTVEKARELSEREALHLIFHPGFSTAENVTDVSGRGVGMDVVRTNIEKLGGTVEIETRYGKGTTINIKLPLTLAIIPSLIIRCGQGKYAIPQVNINELVRIRATEVNSRIERIKDAEVLRLRGNLLPLVRLNQVLDVDSLYCQAGSKELKINHRENIADRRSGEEVEAAVVEQRSGDERREDTIAGALNIIVVESGHTRYGLIVDELYDSKEIVVKPLDKHLKNCTVLAGATILGDGKVSLILDIAAIASFMELSAVDHLESQSVKEVVRSDMDDKQTVLIFSNAPTEYFGIPTAFISRIERIKADQIDSVGGQEVLQYRGGTLSLLCLENYIKAEPRGETDSVYVVVFKAGHQEVGLVAPELVDISDIPAEVDHTTFKEAGVIGSTIVGDKTIRLIDVYELAETAHPEWTSRRTQQQRSNNTSKTILVVEDSSFFRKQLVSFIEAEGYQTIDAEDGSKAWELLQESHDNPAEDVVLIVTDIEMPNMDGLQLTRQIKNDARFSDIPVIAVTSLAGDEDIQKGQEAGVDDYEVKLDRDKLLASIARYIGKGVKQSQ